MLRAACLARARARAGAGRSRARDILSTVEQDCILPHSAVTWGNKSWHPEITKGSPLGDTLSLSCEASVGTSGSNN